MRGLPAGIVAMAAAATLLLDRLGSGTVLRGWVDHLEWATYDWRARLRAEHLDHRGGVTNRVGAVFINDRCLTAIQRARQASWPLPRDVYGTVAEHLLAAGAKAVAMDLLFYEPHWLTRLVEQGRLDPSVFDCDAKLRDTLERHPAVFVAAGLDLEGGGAFPGPGFPGGIPS